MNNIDLLRDSKELKYMLFYKIAPHLFLIIFLLFISNFFSANSHSSQLPRYLGNEKKFRSYIYNPNDVYRYVGHYNYQGFVEFGANEVISTISMGDPSLWLFEHLGNRLFLKPIAKDPDTNMTVITNDKVYHFELTAKIAKSIDDEDLIFVAKFVYPDEEDKNIIQFPKRPKTDEPNLSDLSAYNFNYEFTGEPNIAPAKVFDDGLFTYMQFSRFNPVMPAIFSVDSAGFEELVNFRVAGDYVIIERVSAQFTLRNGSDIVCVYNNDRLKSGATIARANPPMPPIQKRITSSSTLPISPRSAANPIANSPVPGFGSNPFAVSPQNPTMPILPPKPSGF